MPTARNVEAGEPVEAPMGNTKRPAEFTDGALEEKGGRRSQNRGPHASFVELTPHTWP
jgi:hypothetical protein